MPIYYKTIMATAKPRTEMEDIMGGIKIAKTILAALTALLVIAKAVVTIVVCINDLLAVKT